jgi:hypothetical protein
LQLFQKEMAVQSAENRQAVAARLFDFGDFHCRVIDGRAEKKQPSDSPA